GWSITPPPTPGGSPPSGGRALERPARLVGLLGGRSLVREDRLASELHRDDRGGAAHRGEEPFLDAAEISRGRDAAQLGVGRDRVEEAVAEEHAEERSHQRGRDAVADLLRTAVEVSHGDDDPEDRGDDAEPWQ